MCSLPDSRRAIDPDIDPDEDDDERQDDDADEDEEDEDDDQDDENGEKWYVHASGSLHGDTRPVLDFRVRTSYTCRVF